MECDDVDASAEKQQVLLEAQIAHTSKVVASIPVGIPGDCETCAEFNPRLVRTWNPVEYCTQYACSRCRDKLAKVRK